MKRTGDRWEDEVRDVKSHGERDLLCICCGRNWKKKEETRGRKKWRGSMNKM